MKHTKQWMLTAILTMTSVSVFLTSCKGTDADISLVNGTLDAPLPIDSVPAQVMEAIGNANRFHCSDIMSDTLNNISVTSIGAVSLGAEETSTEGYGVVITKGAVSTTFPHMRNVRQPQAHYDASTGNLWLTTSAMEGTGVQVECLQQIRFHENDSAYLVHAINPYDVQQALCNRLGYRIDGQQVTLYDQQRVLTTATNTITDMGGFDNECPLWIGEQIQYDLSSNTPNLLITPGVKFTTGLVLTYDDMPTLTAPITIGDDAQTTIGQLEVLK